MMNKKRTRVLCGSLLLGGLAGVAVPVFADNAAMKELIEILHQKGSITQHEYRLLRNAAKAEQEKTEAAQEEVEKQVAEATKDLPKFSRDKMEIATQDDDFKFRLGGRIHFDTYFVDKDNTGAGRSGTDFRRARIELESVFLKDWRARLQYDFGGGDLSTAGLRDAFVQYRGFDNIDITVGNQKEPLFLEQITSSNNQVFMERSIMNNTFSPERNPGISMSGFFADMFTLTTGVFGQGQVFNSDQDESEGWASTSRVTFSPIHTDNRVVHLGAAYSHRLLDTDQTISFGSREIRPFGSSSLTGTGAIAGSEAESVQIIGGEAAAVYGPFSVSGEYANARVERDSFSNVNFDSYYVEGNVFLTGESRPYSASSGAFGSVKPHRPFLKGGYGAWQVGVRYSSIDLDDKDIAGGEKDTLTVGLNWYPNNYLKFMANYLYTLDIDHPTKPEVDGRHPHAFALRAQAYW